MGTARQGRQPTVMLSAAVVALGVLPFNEPPPFAEIGTAALASVPAVRLQVPPPPPPPTAAPWTVWDRLAECESGGDWAINTGNGYYGGLQFALTSWRAVGGSGYPHQHSRTEQIHRAEKLKAIQGWGAWPACSRKLGLR